MRGGLMQLIAYGAQDCYLGNKLTHSTHAQWGYYKDNRKACNKNGRNGQKKVNNKLKKINTKPKYNNGNNNRYTGNIQSNSNIYEKNNIEPFLILNNENDLYAINFKINGKCCECGQNLVTENMKIFLFYEFHGVHSHLPCEYIHYACKKSACDKTIIDIELVYEKLYTNIINDVDDECIGQENMNQEVIYI